MATYAELAAFFKSDGDYAAFEDRVAAACIIAATDILSETPPANHAERKTWAVGVLENPLSEARRMAMAVVAANDGLSIAAIIGASDSAIKTNVDTYVDLFAGGL